MKVENIVPNMLLASEDSKQKQNENESRGGRPGVPVPNNPYGFCGRKAALNETDHGHIATRCIRSVAMGNHRPWWRRQATDCVT